MFGRRKVPVGSGSQGQDGAAPPGSVEPFPTDKMNDALEAAIKLFTQTLEDAGINVGGLAMRGVPGREGGAGWDAENELVRQGRRKRD